MSGPKFGFTDTVTPWYFRCDPGQDLKISKKVETDNGDKLHYSITCGKELLRLSLDHFTRRKSDCNESFDDLDCIKTGPNYALITRKDDPFKWFLNLCNRTVTPSDDFKEIKLVNEIGPNTIPFEP